MNIGGHRSLLMYGIIQERESKGKYSHNTQNKQRLRKNEMPRKGTGYKTANEKKNSPCKFEILFDDIILYYIYNEF